MKNSTYRQAKPPASLSPEARSWWKRITETFEVDDPAGLLLLENALNAFDEMTTAAALVKADGQVITDRFGQKRQHPGTLVVRDARNLMLRSLKALNLDVTPGAPLGGK